MTVRNPLVRVSGKIIDLPAGDSIGGAAQGPVGMTWQGAWNSGTSYNIDDAVSSGGSSYIAIAANTNQAPPNATYWSLLASIGATGATGPTGPTGATGATGSGGWELVETHTATSGDATMDFTIGISSTYDSYVLEVIGFIPATNNVNLLLRVGTGATPTWDANSDYRWVCNRLSETPSNTAAGSSSATSITLANGGTNITNGSSDTVDLTIFIKHPGDATHKPFYWTGYCLTSTPTINAITGSAQYTQTTAITGLRLLFSSGNIAAGIGRLYGISKT